MAGDVPRYDSRAARFFPSQLPEDVLATGGVVGDGSLEQILEQAGQQPLVPLDLRIGLRAEGREGDRLLDAHLLHDVPKLGQRACCGVSPGGQSKMAKRSFMFSQ